MAKECADGAPGIFSAPVALSILAKVFESRGMLARLENFTSCFGAKFYGLPLNQGTLRLVREPWTIPQEYAGIVPLCAGQNLPWRVA